MLCKTREFTMNTNEVTNLIQHNVDHIPLNHITHVLIQQQQPEHGQDILQPSHMELLPQPQQMQPPHSPPSLQQAPIHTQMDLIEMKPQINSNIKIESHTDKKPKVVKEKDKDKKKKEAIDSQAREIIFKVIRFFESEKQNRGYAFPVENVVKRACAATGLSESTIKRIKRDGLRAEATQTRIAGPKKKRVRKTKVQLDYYQLCALRGIVNGYSVRKEVPTLGKILAAAKHELQYRGGKESLRLILLNKLGIKFKKCEKKIKKPPEEEQPMPQMSNVMVHQQMQPIKTMENECVYSSMMHHVPPAY